VDTPNGYAASNRLLVSPCGEELQSMLSAMRWSAALRRFVAAISGEKDHRPTQGDFVMSALWHSCCRFLQSEDGPTAVEYAFMLALIIMVCILAVRSLGSAASTTFSNAGAGLGTGS
jgi:pilus assembly protein Flp/PilA